LSQIKAFTQNRHRSAKHTIRNNLFQFSLNWEVSFTEYFVTTKSLGWIDVHARFLDVTPPKSWKQKC